MGKRPASLNREVVTINNNAGLLQVWQLESADPGIGLSGDRVERYWNWKSGNNRVRCSPDWSVYRCIERYCMTPRQREDDNNLSVGHRNHLKLGIEPESWLQSHELGF